MSFCEIIIVGNVGQDAELRYTNNGTAVCDLRVAVNRNRRQGEEWIKETTWFSVTVWGQQAERYAGLIKKGMQILAASDRIEADAYNSRNGEARASLKLTAKTIRILSSTERDDYEGGSSGGGGYSGRSSDNRPRNNSNRDSSSNRDNSSNRGGSSYGGDRNRDDSNNNYRGGDGSYDSYDDDFDNFNDDSSTPGEVDDIPF